MIIQKDTMHISFREIDGYNKPFNFIICEREAGKSTEFVSKMYKYYKEGGVSLIFRRNVVDITSKYIESLQEIINKFYDESFQIVYVQSQFKEGIVTLKDKEGKTIALVVALSIKVSRIKSLVLRNIKAIFFDEFICNPKYQEKYLPSEADKFKEAYNTLYRETDCMLKCYFMGNPYSLHNPYFMTWNVDVTKLQKGKIHVHNNIAIWCYEITDELREYILARNPLYEFDEAYKKYAFFGQAVNDENIRLGKLPVNYSMKYVFKIDAKFIAVYQNNYYEDHEDRYFCTFVDYVGVSRNIYCYDFGELIDRSAIISMDDKEKFYRFKRALQRNLVVFSDINVYYLVIELYKNI